MNTSPFLNSSYLSSKSCYYHIHQLCCIRSYLGLYRSNHSTETAVLKVLSDILLALDSGKLALLSLLDLSAAFDIIDHDTLLQRLQTSYGLGGNVIAWFTSYLTGHTHYTVRPDCDVPVDIVSSVIWSAAGFGPQTNPVPPLCCWPAAAGEASWTSSTLLTGSHSSVRSLGNSIAFT